VAQCIYVSKSKNGNKKTNLKKTLNNLAGNGVHIKYHNPNLIGLSEGLSCKVWNRHQQLTASNWPNICLFSVYCFGDLTQLSSSKLDHMV
jgi:hypothetical protein